MTGAVAQKENEQELPQGAMSPDDQLAAEWESSVEKEAQSITNEEVVEGETENLRVLNQDEIDSLLGFSDDDWESDNSGIMALVNSGLVNYERLPMLEVVFDRLVRMMTTSLRNFTSDNVDVNLEQITSVRFGDYLNSIPLPAMLSVFKAEEWDNYGLMLVDSSLIYSVVDVLLGGRKGSSVLRVEGRPYTTIERNLVEKMLHVMMNDMSAAFDPLSPVTFRFDRLETNPKFATIGRPGNAAVLIRLRVDMDDRGGRVEIVIPYATLEPIRELLLQMFMGEKFGRDSIWETHLAKQLWMTHVPLKAVLDEMTFSLNEVIHWQVGSQIVLNCGAKDPVELRCGDVPLFDGKLGRCAGNIAVCIDRKVKRQEMP
ncbi:MAG: flagellar motor switch protein FliM [Alphaproteobacteria bacterium]|jgi:flagellar motor switch protein FliM|nr:flagellar motor switch protein FliM [Alphaproteobacteria bacterium]